MKHGGLTGRKALNPYFRGSQFHHLNLEKDPNLGVYIPIDLHRNTPHNSETGRGFEKINTHVFDWLIRQYNIKQIKTVFNPTYNDFMYISELIYKSLNFKSETGGEICFSDDNKYHIHVRFRKEEAEELIKARELTKLNWCNFILVKSCIIKENEIKSNKMKTDLKIPDHKLTIQICVPYFEGVELQKALKNSGKESWRSYILSLIGFEIEKPPMSDNKIYEQSKEFAFERKKEKLKIHDLKCFSCINGKYDSKFAIRNTSDNKTD